MQIKTWEKGNRLAPENYDRLGHDQALQEIILDLEATLQYLKRLGIPLPIETGEKSMSNKEKATALAEIDKQIRNCSLCGLSKGRKNAVPGEGNPAARVMFIGEGPGEEEDKQGRPFVGKAGELLTKIIENGMGLKQEEVYITNVVKCRPPENRDPLPEEIARCEAYLEEQLDMIQPHVIVTLGRVAAQALLNSNTPISRLRGKFYRYKEIPLMPTFHPAYLLRNPGEKRSVWEDIKKVISLLQEKGENKTE